MPAGGPRAWPGDRARPVQMSGQGGTLPMVLGGDSVERARAFAKAEDATVFMTLLAVYVAMLHRMTGQDDLVIGIPVRGRATEEMESVMGLFRNTLPLRIRLAPADRKSTRLNSSHITISYAVFWLKKKKRY